MSEAIDGQPLTVDQIKNMENIAFENQNWEDLSRIKKIKLMYGMKYI